MDCIGGLSTVPSFLKKQTKKRKVCQICTDDIKRLSKIIESSQLIFGKNSHHAEQWLKHLVEDGTDLEALKRQFQVLSETPKAPKNSEAQKILDKLLSSLESSQDVVDWFSKNYSFCQVLSMVFENDNSVVRDPVKQIRWVCQCFVNQFHDSIGFSEHIFQLIVALLCFMEPYKAWVLLVRVYERIIP